MDTSQHVEALRHVNEEVAKVIKQLQETNDKNAMEYLIYELANRVYLMGLKDGQKNS